MAGFNDPQITHSQDYNLLAHLKFILTGEPLPTCHVGLAPINLLGKNKEAAAWLSKKLQALNADYVARLQRLGATSNITAILMS